MDVVDLDELAAEQAVTPAARPRLVWPRPRLPRSRRLWGVVVGVLALALLTGWAVGASRSPLSAQVLGMRNGPEIGWTLSGGVFSLAVVEGDRVVSSDGATVRARRGSDGAELWAVAGTELGFYGTVSVRDLPGTPWLFAGTDGYSWPEGRPVVLLDRDTGRVAHTMELSSPEFGVDEAASFGLPTLFSSTDGALLFALPTNDGRVSLARLNAPRGDAAPSVDDVAWRTELDVSADAFPWWWPAAESRAGYLLIGMRFPGEWPDQFLTAVRESDGAPAPWDGSDYGGFNVFGDVALVPEDGGAVAYDLRSGAELWSRPGLTPLYTSDGVLAERAGGRLTLLSPRSGRQLWSVPTDDDHWSLVRSGDNIVVSRALGGTWSEDPDGTSGVVAAYRLATGRQLWRVDLGAAVVDLARGEGQLVVTTSRTETLQGEGDMNVLLTASSALTGLDPATGRVRWAQEPRENSWQQRFGTRMFQDVDGDAAVLR